MNEQPVVDFLGIGAQRAGTTWIHSCLRHHPELWLPNAKEIHYFDRLVRHGWGEPPTGPPLPNVAEVCLSTGLDAPNRWKLLASCLRGLATGAPLGRKASLRALSKGISLCAHGEKNDAWYRSRFRRGNGLVKGEITPAYAILDQPRVRHVTSLFPSVKVFFILRDPVARTISHIRLNHDLGLVKTPFADLIQSPEFRLRNDYLRTINIWSAHLPPSNFFVGWYDDLEADPVGFLGKLFAFLGVDVSHTPLIVPAVGAITTARNCRPSVDIPSEVISCIARDTRPMIAALADRYAGHPARWLERCDRILAG
ncbi:MAG: sulfotransferase [Chthoniobacterales bacterium]|nr:sulfotransferase [Chthoniobacterales bacterium]